MNSLIDNRTIRVFISSTFQDMQDERTELIRRTFPRLRELAAQRDVTLTEVDLRWGITKEESESGKVMEICLREVENSIPFFIGIIGNRYGWIPGQKDISDIVKERFKEVPNYVERHLSATEIEMQFGVLDRKDVDMNAYFFIKEEKATDIDEPERLASLKKAVRENKKYPVSTYKNPEDLADQVLAAFTKLLDDLFPVGELSAIEKERLGQRAVLNNLSRVYIKTESNFAVIDKWMEDWEKHQLVITGASGLGKSALVANWIKEKLKLGEELPYRIIYHFVGYGGSVGSDWHVVKALCDEIRDRYGFEADEREPKTDEKALDDLFKRVAVEGDKPLLIVLDGINQIIDVNYAKRLNWLPIPPKKVKILFTTLEDDGTMEVFKDRKYPIFTLQFLTREERMAMVSTYLKETYSKSLQPTQLERIADDPQNVNTLVLKTLLDEIANFGSFEILDEKIEEYLKPDSISDFYQVVLQNYEADFGDELVRHFLSLIAVSRNGLSEEEILEITCTKDKPILWSQFFCSFRQHMVVKNGLVSFAHGYIREAIEERYIKGYDEWVRSCREEIVATLENQLTREGKKTSRSMEEVPFQLDLLGNLPGLHDYLIDLDVFWHLNSIKIGETISLGKYWRKLIYQGGYSILDYIAEVRRKGSFGAANRLRVLHYFARTMLGDIEASLQFLAEALDYATNERKRAGVFDSIGRTYYFSGSYQQALEFGFFKSLAIYRRDLMWDDTELKGPWPDGYYDKEYRVLAQSFSDIGRTYAALHDYQQALEYKGKALKLFKCIYGEEHATVRSTLISIGKIYCSLHDYQKAMEYAQKALSGLNEHQDVYVYDLFRTIYEGMGNSENALKYALKNLDCWRHIYGDSHIDVADAFKKLGMTYRRFGLYDKALEGEEKALEVYLQVLGENHPNVAESYNIIGCTYKTLGQLEKANECFQKSAEIWKKLAEKGKEPKYDENAKNSLSQTVGSE